MVKRNCQQTVIYDKVNGSRVNDLGSKPLMFVSDASCYNHVQYDTAPSQASYLFSEVKLLLTLKD
jgi:hypothetical protein